MDIGEPSVLLRLPRSPQGTTNTRFGLTWGLRGGVKRKRHEVCTAVEGVGVNIYDVQNGRNVFSHVVPPNTTFSGPPTSLRWKDDGTIFRQTCFATSDHGLSIHLIKSAGEVQEKPLSIELSASISAVVHLEVSKEAAEEQITVVQEDGTVTVLTNDLKILRTKKLFLDTGAALEVITATVLPLKVAQKSILRARPDLVATFTHDCPVVVTVSDAPDADTLKRNVTYAAWAVTTSNLARSGSELEIHLLFEHDLSKLAPAIESPDSEILSAHFGPRNHSLDLRLSRGLIRFDLQGPVPRPFATISQGLGRSLDVIPISQSHILASYPDALRIIDVNYATVHSNRESKPKRRKNGERVGAQTQFISYFAHLGRVLARDGVRLLAIDIGSSTGTEVKRLTTSTLADNIGKGVTGLPSSTADLTSLDYTIGGSAQSEPLPRGWKTNLDSMISNDEIAQLEEVVFKSFEVRGTSPQTSSTSTSTLPDELVSYLLSKLFSMLPSQTDPQELSLRVNFAAPRILSALNTRGLLRTAKLQQVLRPPNGQSTIHFRYDDMVKALATADTSLKLVEAYARSLTSPDAHEVTCILKVLVQMAEMQSGLPRQQLLTAQSSDEMQIDVQQTPDAVTLSPSLHGSLVLVLDRLGRFGMSHISSNLRRTLTRDEIFIVVQLLRQQMFRAGHTGSLQSLEEDGKVAASEVSLESTVKILSGCLDTFGPLDLVSSFEDEYMDAIIPDLLSEISLATQYIEESADLQGILRETLRYAETREPTTTKSHGRDGKEGDVQRPGQILTLYAQKTEDEDINGLPGALPLSLRADEAIKPTKTRKGGGQIKDRSQREMLMLESRQKGPYTFERLIL